MKKIYMLFCSLIPVAFLGAQNLGTNINYANQKIAPPVQPDDGSGTLGQTYNSTQCGLTYVQTTVKLGQRFSPPGVPQPATYAISGLPACQTVIKAFFWITTSGTGASITVNITNPLLASASFPMTMIGNGPDKCWSYSGTYSYRADVTTIIAGNGNYLISGLPTGSPDDIDGGTLMIIYKDNSATYEGTLVIHDGAAVMAPGNTNQTVNGFNACATDPNATAFMIVGDFQNAGAQTSMNGSPYSAGPQDWFDFIQQTTTITAGQTTCAFGVTSSSDCYDFAVAGVYYRTTTCTTCVPTSPSPITLSSSSTPATCGNNNGTATAIPSGGTPPYTYLWTPTGQTTATATGLAAGTYTVSVGDASGCGTSTLVITVSSTGSATLSSTQTNVACNGGNNGSGTITATGGSPPYNYSWSPAGGTNATATGLTAGTYTVTVTDGAGCTNVITVSITQPNALNVTLNSSPPSCSSSTVNGTATVSGGTPGYFYSWNPTGQTTVTATGLTSGTYTVTVTDANGCTSTQTISITVPALLSVPPPTSTNVLCNGGNTGTATAIPSGGTPGYSYSWSPAGGTNANATGLTAGNYTVTVTDINGCTATATVSITQPSALTASASAVNPNCFGSSTGNITVTAVGGTPGYTYSWSPSGGTNANATGLAAGTYVCTITDLNGCTTTVPATLTQPTQITVTTTTTAGSCGLPNGSASVTASGGTPGYIYVWNPGGQTSATATGLLPGNYTVIVTDLNGCTASSPAVTVGTTAAPSAAATAFPPTGTSPLTVTFTNTSTGGTSYWWSFGNGDTSIVMSPTYTFNGTGTYNVMLIVSNGAGCSDTLYFTIEVFSISSLIVPNVFTPTGDGINDLFVVNAANISEFNMQLYDRWGMLMSETSDPKVGWDGKAKSGKPAPEGTYYYIISAKGEDDKDYHFTGYLMLLRK